MQQAGLAVLAEVEGDVCIPRRAFLDFLETLAFTAEVPVQLNVAAGCLLEAVIAANIV